jgi:hypothetical protein
MPGPAQQPEVALSSNSNQEPNKPQIRRSRTMIFSDPLESSNPPPRPETPVNLKNEVTPKEICDLLIYFDYMPVRARLTLLDILKNTYIELTNDNSDRAKAYLKILCKALTEANEKSISISPNIPRKR